MSTDIDFVLTYVDPNDPEWQHEKNKYTPNASADTNKNRYRDWDNLQYFFRGVERFAPWVRKIHFVTCGHVPHWLNLKHPKLNIVKHTDYIPPEWLPTFSSRCIDMNLHRIENLSEQFVYFNDDMFLTDYVSPENFFKNGLPRDIALLGPTAIKHRDGIALYLAPVVDTAIINKHFPLKQTIKQKPGNWFSLKYGIRPLMRSAYLMTYHSFCGFWNPHTAYSYLKSTYREVWEAEPEICQAACKYRFREPSTANHLLFSYWQYASNQFTPRSRNERAYFPIYRQKNVKDAVVAISEQKYKIVCVNDNLENNDDFPEIVNDVNSAFNSILGEKSSFEISGE